MPALRSSDKASFPAFFLMWATMQGWDVPALHWEMVHWLATNGDKPLTLVQVFRGAAKSTIVGVYEAWRLYLDPASVVQVWGADRTVAGKMARYVRHVLARHPLCGGMLDPRAPNNGFFVAGARDMRNPSMEAIGIDSSATGSRSTDTVFDDVEVPKNIRTAAKRESLRGKIDEAMHILVPGGRRMYVGTPHTHETVYKDVADEGAAQFKRPLFGRHVRHKDGADRTRFDVPFAPGPDGLYLFLGVGKFARLLVEGRDYRSGHGWVEFDKPPGKMLDIYADCAWPERFVRPDLLIRRKACRTINTWDSQYQLEAVAVTRTRLDPDRMPVYDVEPHIEQRNGRAVMVLGKATIAGFVAYWDVSLGKVKSDASALCLMLTDHAGRLYWHRAVALTGELELLDRRGRLVGGQIRQLLDVLTSCHVHHCHVETNGPGGFVPPILTRHAKPLGIGVSERHQAGNKQARILDAFEAPLSSRFLWCHQSVVESPAFEQMRQFDPAIREQPDDYLDAGAGAIHETPIRLGRILPTAGQPVVRTQGLGHQNAEVVMDFGD